MKKHDNLTVFTGDEFLVPEKKKNLWKKTKSLIKDNGFIELKARRNYSDAT